MVYRGWSDTDETATGCNFLLRVLDLQWSFVQKPHATGLLSLFVVCPCVPVGRSGETCAPRLSRRSPSVNPGAGGSGKSEAMTKQQNKGGLQIKSQTQIEGRQALKQKNFCRLMWKVPGDHKIIIHRRRTYKAHTLVIRGLAADLEHRVRQDQNGVRGG